MSTFQLDNTYIDDNRLFLINLSDIEGRLDPYYYKKDFKIIDEKFLRIPHTTFKKASIKIFSGITPKSKSDSYTTKEEGGIPFIRSGDFSQDNIIDFNKINYIKPEVHNILMKSSRLQQNDLLIAIVGATIGKVGIYAYNKEANINQAICAVRFQDDFLPSFIHIFLLTPLGQKIIDRLKRPVARANINLDEIGSILLPILDIEKQKEIIDFYYEKIKEKQAKEIEAEELLESIDTYLLNKLDIVLPQIDHDLDKRIFTVNFSEITHQRLDPDYNIKIKLLDNLHLKYQPIEVRKLIIKSPQYGANEIAIEPTTKDFTRYIRITDIQEDGTLKFTGIKTAEKIEKQYLLNYNDILFARSGSVGRCYIHKEVEQKAIFAGYLIRFILDEKKINPDYFFYYCQSSIYKFWVSAIERPAVQSNINSEEYKSLKIPLPSREKQDEIVRHIKSIRDKAKELQDEALEILENAKKEVEKMILGE